ncbi:MAG: endonuclease, partial [Chloroflexi bacterium]|nr:endonuclease [Chloroflexota bacterium]
MPTILDPLPANVQAEIDALRTALDQSIPAKMPGQNLLIGTWNLRAFGSLTRKWTATSADSPKRDLRAAVAIAEILSR